MIIAIIRVHVVNPPGSQREILMNSKVTETQPLQAILSSERSSRNLNNADVLNTKHSRISDDTAVLSQTKQEG